MIRAVDVMRLINLYGEPLILVKKTFATYSPATGTITSTSTNQAFTGYNATFDLAEIDGSSVIRGDRKVLMGVVDSAGAALSPDVDDEITGNGDRVTVVSVTKIMSGTTPVCYICQVRE